MITEYIDTGFFSHAYSETSEKRTIENAYIVGFKIVGC